MLGKVFNSIVALFYLFYVGYIVFKYKDKLPYKLTVVTFTLIIFIPHIFFILAFYYRYGIDNWNVQNLFPVANINPFMFVMAFVVLFLPKPIKNVFYLLTALLSFATILAGISGCFIYFKLIPTYEFQISIEWLSHLTMGLLGIYLILSKRVEFTVKNTLIASISIFGVALMMVVLNLIFDTSFFGLAFNGTHNIYNLIFIESPYLSALVYFVGLAGALFLGYWFLKLVIRIDKKLVLKKNDVKE